jgi:hypothetical protein
MKARFLIVAFLVVAGLDGHVRAAPVHAAGSFHGTVYQIDTVYNFVDVIMPGGTTRFYADPDTIVQVQHKRAELIDIAMGEQVRGTYRTDAKGTRTVVTIDDLGPK